MDADRGQFVGRHLKTEATRYRDYRNASNPPGEGGLAAVPGARFPAEHHAGGITRTLPLDTIPVPGCPARQGLRAYRRLRPPCADGDDSLAAVALRAFFPAAADRFR